MNDQPKATPKMSDSLELSKFLAGIAERSQRLLADSMRRQMETGALLEVNPMNVGEAFTQMTAQLMAKPVHMVRSNINLF